MSDCIHLDFVATAEVSRLFSEDVPEEVANTIKPHSLAIDLRIACSACGKPVRFEGPIGVAVGPGAQPMVSVDGLELRAAGHMGDNDTPPITMRLSLP